MRKIRKMTKQLSAIAMAFLVVSSSIVVFAETENIGDRNETIISEDIEKSMYPENSEGSAEPEIPVESEDPEIPAEPEDPEDPVDTENPQVQYIEIKDENLKRAVNEQLCNPADAPITKEDAESITYLWL